MSAAYTPGPWAVTGSASVSYASFSIKGRDGRGICAIASNIKRMGAESQANATLIAAAPELVALVQRLVKLHDDGHIQARSFADECRAVLAKVSA